MSSPYRYAQAVPRDAATGPVALVYGQMAEEFLLADGPLMSLSPAPELIAATWALLREAELTGAAPRVEKEAVAAAVAHANRCPFCTEAHALLVHGADEHDLAEAARTGAAPDDPHQAAVIAWAGATREPGAAALAAPPFPPAQAPEFVGTALVSHFINRMVSVLLDENALLPAPVRRSRLVRRAVGRTVRSRVRRELRPGRSLEILEPADAAGPLPSWAAAGPIGVARAALGAAARAGGGQLATGAKDAVLAAVADWDGGHPPLGGTGWLDAPLAELPSTERPGARLALLTALAPYRVTDADIAAWRGEGRSRRADADLVRLLAFGAMAAVDRIESWIAPATSVHPLTARRSG